MPKRRTPFLCRTVPKELAEAAELEANDMFCMMQEKIPCPNSNHEQSDSEDTTL